MFIDCAARPLVGAPAERNVALSGYGEHTFRSAGAKSLRDPSSINILVPLGLSDLVKELRQINKHFKI